MTSTTDLNDISLAQAFDLIDREGARIKAEYGFSRVSFDTIKCGDGAAVVAFFLIDDFQASMDYATRIGVGLREFTLFHNGGVWSLAPVRRLMKREERELRFLSGKSADLIESADEFATEFARGFVADLVARRDEIAGLLTHDAKPGE